jgi:hypothetical protein
VKRGLIMSDVKSKKNVKDQRIEPKVKKLSDKDLKKLKGGIRGPGPLNGMCASLKCRD